MKKLSKLLSVMIITAIACSMVLTSCNDSGNKPTDDKYAGYTGQVHNDLKVGGSIILGSTTKANGYFRFPSFTGGNPNAADLEVNELTTGYATMTNDQSGNYVWDTNVVKEHTEVEVDGANGAKNYKITIEIKEGLKLSDGSEITADNYLAYILAFSTVVAKAAGSPAKAGQTFAGFASYYKYTGVEAEGATKEFAGVRKISDYKFSLEVDGSAGYYPYYYAFTYGAVSPYDLKLILGDNVSVKDDGNGAYLTTDKWFEKGAEDKYVHATHLNAVRLDYTTYAYSGAYVVKSYNSSIAETTLSINPYYTGNFEGQKPHIQTVILGNVVSETQTSQLSSGRINVLSGITGGDDVNAALALVKNGNFKENHYDRAGYGKIQFDCDFGPTMFASVRQAVAYSLDREDFANTFTGGYGAVVNGPFATASWMYKKCKSDFNKAYSAGGINTYSISLESAKKALQDDGWIYNKDGSAYSTGVRYKKLTAEEASAANIAYKSISNTDGVEYKTEKVGSDYFMPCVINWFASSGNPVSDLLVTKLMKNTNVANAGMIIRQNVGDFDALLDQIYREGGTYGGTPIYGMYNLATGFTSSIYDFAFNWSLDDEYFGYSVNKLFDSNDKAFAYKDHKGISYTEAMTQSGNKLGMDYLSMATVYEATTEDEYVEWWKAYIYRWNELMPDIPLYANIYYDVYSSDLINYKTSPYWNSAQAIVYCGLRSVEA